MKLKEVKNNPEIIGHLYWDLPWVACPADFDRLIKLLAQQAGYFFYVDVCDCQARLALVHNKPDGTGTTHLIEDFECPLLEKAVYEAGGNITTSGWYPVSKQLKRMIQKKLGVL